MLLSKLNAHGVRCGLQKRNVACASLLQWPFPSLRLAPSPRTAPGKLHDNRLRHAEEMFLWADLDRDGRLNSQELQRVLESTENAHTKSDLHWYTKDEVDAVMKHYDADNSSDLTFEEFKEVVYDGLILEGKLAEYQRAFTIADEGGDGTLCTQELANMFTGMGIPASDSEQEFRQTLATALQKYDSHENGCIDFPGFLKMCKDRLFELKEVTAFAKGQVVTQCSNHAIVETHKGEASIISGEDELNDVLERHQSQLVVLFAGMTWNYDDDAMQEPYQALAAHYEDAVFLTVYGNMSAATRKLVKRRLKVRATPAFYFFKDGQCVASLVTSSGYQVEAVVRKLMSPKHIPHDYTLLKDYYWEQ